MRKNITIKKLNLGCGLDIKKGYINLDKSKLKGVDVAHDSDKYPGHFQTTILMRFMAKM